MSKTATNAAIRQFISQHFNVPELTSFCFSYFPEIGDEFPPDMPKSARVELLIGYCQRRSLMPNLLTALAQEREKPYQQTFPTIKPATLPATIIHNPRQIFISHAHQDAEIARKLATDLKANGYPVWIAPDSIHPGEKWTEAINRGLEESGKFLLLLSPDAVVSKWVKLETHVAIQLNQDGHMQIVPLMLQACRVPALWRAYQHIPLRNNYPQALARLLAALAHSESSPPLEIFQKDRHKMDSTLPKDDNLLVHPITHKEMVRVPAGPFVYQDGEWAMHLDEFWIDKTPVTHADYKRFIDANPKHEVPFVDEEWAQPYNWNKQYRTFRHELADHPVVLVSWHDAKAYAKWAECDLPSEQQWEKAARGTDGRQYPWGEWQENHCNTSEAGINKTTPVGQFSPQGDSPYGCVDMSGNVWEWTDSLYREGSSSRVLRGGSWRNNANHARAAYRGNNHPDDRNFDLGFRVGRVRCSPSHRAADH